jgi:hypothetical protein
MVDVPPGQSPRGIRFVRPVRFDHQGEDWTNNAWSLVISTEGLPNDQGCQFGSAMFLVPDAPHEWLSAGKRFTLYEGYLPIAEGIVEPDESVKIQGR